MQKKSDVAYISISTETMVRAILLVLGMFLFWVLRDLVLIILTSIVIASFVESAVPHLARIGFSRVFGIVFLYASALLCLSGVFYLFAPLLITEIYNFSMALSTYAPNVQFLDYFQSEAFSGAKDVVSGLSKNLSLSSLLSVSKAFMANLSGGFFQTLSVAFGSIFNLFSIIIISFYLSIQEKGIENFLRLIFQLSYEDYVVDLWQRSRRKIALWMKGQLLLGFLVAVLIYLTLSLLGVEYALLLAMIAGIMELVPYGILVALVPALSFSYFSGGISSALMVAGSYFIIHQFEVFLFAPLVIEKVVGLSPIVIILAALVGFELGGLWGVLLAIPGAVLVMELITDVEKHKALARTKNEEK
ncbi:AI-2E family transporter [Candidatus Nomurabacteria bacterium]|nr:AI-2E family transporter [Candidatus Nomurabacteria bacterium]